MKCTFQALALTALLISACGGEAPPADICSGVWVGRAGGDSFAFQFNEGLSGDLPGVIHCLRDGRKYSEVPMGTVEWQPPQLTVFVEVTGVTYSGTMEDGVIRGGLSYASDPSMDMDLYSSPAESLPGLLPLTGEYSYSPPAELDDGITTASCEEEGIPAAAVEEMISRIVEGDAGVVHSLLVFSGGKLVIEEYFHGYGPDDLHRLASSTKSVSSLLTGIAMDQGLIDSVTVPLAVYFPEADPELRLDHLLTMSMGLDWTDGEAESVHGTGEEMFRLVLSRGRSSGPGEGFRYVNPDVNLLSGIIRQATGMYPEEYAEERLFIPLGIEEWDWSYGAVDGHRLMDGSLQLRPRDMGRIGLMVGSGGTWEGSRVVSGEWLSEYAVPRFQVDTLFDYGYLWWLTSLRVGGREMDLMLASGWGSQFIAVVPEAGIVIVTTGGNEDNGKNWNILRLVQEVLYPV